MVCPGQIQWVGLDGVKYLIGILPRLLSTWNSEFELTWWIKKKKSQSHKNSKDIFVIVPQSWLLRCFYWHLVKQRIESIIYSVQMSAGSPALWDLHKLTSADTLVFNKKPNILWKSFHTSKLYLPVAICIFNDLFPLNLISSPGAVPIFLPGDNSSTNSSLCLPKVCSHKAVMYNKWLLHHNRQT